MYGFREDIYLEVDVTTVTLPDLGRGYVGLPVTFWNLSLMPEIAVQAGVCLSSGVREGLGPLTLKTEFRLGCV